jgi:hypothetical protein
MADTFTPVLNMVKPEIDASAETWGQKLNADLDLLDAFAGEMRALIAAHPPGGGSGGDPVAALPRGVIVAWAGTPNNVPTGWLLCNGSNGTPNLTDRFILGNTGTRAVWSAGGDFGHTETTAAAGTHAHFGSVTSTALNTDQVPAHQHAGYTDASGIHQHGYMRTNEAAATSGGPGIVASEAYFGARLEGTQTDGSHAHNIITDFRGGGQGHLHYIYDDGSHTHTANITTTPPYFSLCYIMRA